MESRGASEPGRGTLWETARGAPQSAQGGRCSLLTRCKSRRGYLTPWLDSAQVRRVHGGGADGAGPARLLGRWDHYPERTDRLGRSEGVTFAGAQVGTGERRTEGLVRSDTGGLLIQGGS